VGEQIKIMRKIKRKIRTLRTRLHCFVFGAWLLDAVVYAVDQADEH